MKHNWSRRRGGGAGLVEKLSRRAGYGRFLENRGAVFCSRLRFVLHIADDIRAMKTGVSGWLDFRM